MLHSDIRYQLKGEARLNTHYHLRCLGPPAFFGPSGNLIRFRTKKHLALLVFLLLEERGAHRRDRLAEFLWPRAPMAGARHSLATALSILRPRLPADALQATRDQVRLRTTQITTDVDQLLARDKTSSEGLETLDVGGFLDGFDIPDAPEFSLWKDRQQARLLPLIKDALVLLISRKRRTGQSKEVELLADRMLALDELSEEGVRAKMEARAWAGDRLSALKIFEDWKRRLFDDLHAVPSERLELMAATLRRGGWERAAINDIPVVPIDRGRGRAFVGRAGEYRRLYETWEALKQGRPTHSMILGDSGVGKTTLVERFATAVALEGAAVARVQAYDLDRNIPFATLGGLGLSLLDIPGASTSPPEALAEVARAVPEVRRRFPNLPSPGQSQGETARIRLTEAFQQLLLAIAEERPLIIVVDDLHLADEPSLAVLHLALRRSESNPILAVFTGRSAELSLSAQATLLRENLSRLGGQEVLLSPLTPHQCSELLEDLFRPNEPRPSATVRRSLIGACGGYPMVLELLVHDWRRHGPQSVAIALEGMTADFVVGDDPGAVYGPLLSRLADSVGPATRSALALASILGHRLNDLSMYSLVDLGLGQTMAALGQLLDTRILRDGERGLDFTNELIRAHIYSSIPSPVRKALHASVSDRIRQSEDRHAALSGLEIAWHTMRSGRAQEAIPHLLEGSKTAMRSGAPQSAERALSSALGSISPESTLDVRLLLAQALQEQGRWRESLEVLEPIQDEPDNERMQEVFALASFARGYMGLTAPKDLLDALPMLEHTIRSCRHVLSRVRAARALAQGLTLLRDRVLAQRLLPLVNAIPVDELDIDAQAQLILARAMFLFQAGAIEASYREAERGLQELRTAGAANAAAVHLQSGLGTTRSLQGRYQEAAAHYLTCLDMARRLGNDAIASSILANLSLVYFRLGRPEEALSCEDEIGRLGLGELADWSDVTLTYSTGMVHALNGNITGALTAVSRLDARLPRDILPALLQRWLLWKADILMIAGAHNDAMATGSIAVKGYDFELRSLGFAGAFARWTAMTCRGDEQECRARLVLASLESDIEQFDAMDQLEILCAASYLRVRHPGEYVDNIIAKAQCLPGPTVDTIRKLGMSSCV